MRSTQRLNEPINSQGRVWCYHSISWQPLLRISGYSLDWVAIQWLIIKCSFRSSDIMISNPSPMIPSSTPTFDSLPLLHHQRRWVSPHFHVIFWTTTISLNRQFTSFNTRDSHPSTKGVIVSPISLLRKFNIPSKQYSILSLFQASLLYTPSNPTYLSPLCRRWISHILIKTVMPLAPYKPNSSHQKTKSPIL